MVDGLKAFDLDQAKQLVRSAVTRDAAMHERWGLERTLVATGTLETVAANLNTTVVVAGQLLAKLGVVENTINLILPSLSLIHATEVPRELQHQLESRAGGEAGDNAALVASRMLDDVWYRASGLDVLHRCAWDFVTIGECVGRVAYEYEEERWKLTDSELEDAFDDMLIAAGTVAEEQGVRPSDLVSVSDIEDSLPQEGTRIVRDGVVISYVDPVDFYMDPLATCLADARWVAVRTVLPVDEVLARKDFANTDTVTPDGPLGDGHVLPGDAAVMSATTPGTVPDDPSMTATLWEFYDIRKRHLLVFQMGASAPLLDEDWPLGITDVPFAHQVRYREKPADAHGFGEVRNIAPLQILHTEFLTLQVENARKVAAHKYAISDDLEITDEVRDGLTSDIAGEVVRIPNPDQRPMSELIATFQPNPLSSEVFNMTAVAENGVGTTLALSDFQRGGSGASRMSGTAAAVVDGVSTTRAQPRVEALSAFAAQLSRLALHLVHQVQFAGQDGTEAVRGEETITRKLTFATPRGSVEADVTGALLSGDFEIKVRGADSAKNPATRKREGMEIIRDIIPSIKSLDPEFDIAPLLRHAFVLLDMDPDAYFKHTTPTQAPTAAGGAAGMDPAAMAAALGGGGGVPPQLTGTPQQMVGGLPAAAELGGDIVL